MNESKLKRLVEETKTESDLSHNWLVEILNTCAPQESLKRHWEKKHQQGRCDLSLRYGDRDVCIVETKIPTVTNLQDYKYFQQAHRYAYSQNYWRNGKLVPPLGILTNGYTAIIFDGGMTCNKSFKTKEFIDLTNTLGLKKFHNIFKNLSEGKLGHRLHSEPKTDERNLIVEELSKELLKYYNWFSEQHTRYAFEYMLQMFLISVLRDCGFIPTREMRKCYESGNWNNMSILLNEMLSANFHLLPKGKQTVVERVYQETTTLCARLDRVPPDCLGLVYEKILHKIHGEAASTSYYTPQELALTVIKKLDLKPRDRFLDPSCGSGTFLTAAIDYLAKKYPEMRNDKALFSYVKRNLCGVDRDVYACHVAKTMVLAAVATHLDFDPAERELRLPKLDKTIIHTDLFLYEPSKKFDAIAGNLPWGHVDGRRKDLILDPKIRKSMGLNEYESYYRNVDISSICLEHIRELFLQRKGRLGLLVKQQTLYGSGSKKFQDYAKKAGIKFWDYGAKKWFENPASLTAISWVKTGQKNFIEKQYESGKSIAEDGLELKKYGSFFKGFESAADPVYRLWARRNPNSQLVMRVYPTLRESRHFLLPRASRRIAFIRAGISATPEFVEGLESVEEQRLLNRAQVAQAYSYSWRGSEGIEHYRFDGTQMRIVFSRNFTYGNRMFGMLDKKGECIGITSHTIFIPNDETEEWQVYTILGWLNSKYLKDELERVDVKKLAHGGYGVYPKEISKVKIPLKIFTEDFGIFVKNGIENGALNVEMLDNRILNLCEEERLKKIAG